MAGPLLSFLQGGSKVRTQEWEKLGWLWALVQVGVVRTAEPSSGDPLSFLCLSWQRKVS